MTLDSDHGLRRVLKQSLGERVRETSPGELWRVLLHATIIALCFLSLRQQVSYWKPLAGLLGVLIGHSYACLAFLAHDVSHGSVVRGKRLRYSLEFVLWVPLVVPPTVWRILHNRTHHNHANTPADCDRAYILSDENLSAKIWYMRLFSPLKGSLSAWNPLGLLHFPTYVVRNILLLGAKIKLPIIATSPRITSKERAMVLAEIFVLVGLHIFFVTFMWRGFDTLVIVELVPILVASTVLMAFIFTNHLGRPVLHEQNILKTSVSLKIPRTLCWLYSDFNFHVEHHLFPSTPSKYYASVSRELQEIAGDRYSFLGFFQAWKEVLASPFLRPECEPIKTALTRTINPNFAESESNPAE